MTEIQNIHEEIEKIKERNRRVEGDKAWETSWFRIILVTAIIYGVAVLFMYLIGIEKIWGNALVPAGGYFLSEQSLPFIKRWWLKNFYHK